MGYILNKPAQGALRIALVSEHASPLAVMGSVDAGGQNVYVNHVARCLGKMGHRVDVFTRQDSPDQKPVVEMAPRVRVRHIKAGPAAFVPKEQLLPHIPAFAAGMRRVIERGGYDVIHANFFMSGLAASYVNTSLNLPLVMTFHALGLVRRQHQSTTDAFPEERIDIERMLVRQADAIVAECPQDEKDLLDLYHADPSRMTMVPCGIDIQEIYPVGRAGARAALGLADDEFVILQLGRLVPRKGVDNVIRALAFLPREVKVRLVIVGGESREPDPARTPEIGRLLQIAQECGVADKVLFTGQRDRSELSTCFGAADVFVTTPWYEPFGITPLEAMACGVPVIGAKVGGIQYSVVDGVTGLLVPPKDPQSLAYALMRLQARPDMARTMGLAGLERVRTRFTWERVAAKLAAVYRGTIAAHAGALDMSDAEACLAALRTTPSRHAAEAAPALLSTAAPMLGSAL